MYELLLFISIVFLLAFVLGYTLFNAMFLIFDQKQICSLF